MSYIINVISNKICTAIGSLIINLKIYMALTFLNRHFITVMYFRSESVLKLFSHKIFLGLIFYNWNENLQTVMMHLLFINNFSNSYLLLVFKILGCDLCIYLLFEDRVSELRLYFAKNVIPKIIIKIKIFLFLYNFIRCLENFTTFLLYYIYTFMITKKNWEFFEIFHQCKYTAETN